MKALLMIMCFFTIQYSYACPELEGVDLASGNSKRVYTELSSSSIELTKEEFYSMPNWSDTQDYEAYEKCRDAMVVKKLRHKSTGKIFNALISYEDKCDGGNSVGALYSENMVMRLGDIGDSFITCY